MHGLSVMHGLTVIIVCEHTDNGETNEPWSWLY